RGYVVAFSAHPVFTMFFVWTMASFRKISDKPVRIVTNSHSHGDHVQNNANLAKMRALLFATPHFRNGLMRQGQPQAQGATPPPAGAPAAAGGGRGGGQAPVPPAG